MDELKKTKELVEKYLRKKYPDKKFSEPDLKFLAKYSVNKEPSPNAVLKSIGADIQTEQAYSKNCRQKRV